MTKNDLRIFLIRRQYIYINKKDTIYKAYYISNQKQKKVDIFKILKMR
jgi:hypothetical protein